MAITYFETLSLCKEDKIPLTPKHIVGYFKGGTNFGVMAYYCKECKSYNGYKESDIEKLARKLLPPFCSGKEISKLEILWYILKFIYSTQS